MGSVRALVAVVLAAGLWASMPGSAHARQDRDFTYRREQVWSAAVRMVRVDLRYRVTDRDEEVGYLLFEYEDRGNAHPASIELVRTVVDGRRYVRVVVTIRAMPSYIEAMLLDRLTRKLREEFGEPPPAERVPEPDPPDDDGDGGEDDDDGDESDGEEGEGEE